MKSVFPAIGSATFALILCSAFPAAAQEAAFDADPAEEPTAEVVVTRDDETEDPAEALALEVDDLAPAETDEPADDADDADDAADGEGDATDAEDAPEVEETVVVEVPDGDSADEPAPAEEEPAPAEEEPAPAEEEPTPSAPVSADGEPLVSMAFEQSTLEDVVAAFRTQTGANIVNAWTNQFTQLVSVRLDDVPWTQGLSSILVPFGLQLREEPRGSHIYIVAEPRRTAPPRFTETFELKHLEAPEVAKLFAGILPKDCLVYGEPSANVVVVKATDEQINECKSILGKIDKPSQQVYIEARFVRLSAGASKKLGLKWDSLENFGVSLSHLTGGFSMSDAKLATFGVKADSNVASAAVGDSRTRSWAGDIETSTRSLEQSAATAIGRGSYRTTANSTVSDDSVSVTLNDSTLANLTANDLGYRHTAGFGGQLSVSDFGLVMRPRRKGTSVCSRAKRTTVDSDTPTVSPNGLITVEIVPTISELTGQKTVYVTSDSSIGNDYPIIALRRLDTKFTMEDGKTAVIGGLTQTSEKTVDSGIPLLRHIPWIGPRLFGWKSREKTQDEILVFVTVRVADPATEAADGLPKNSVLGQMLMDGRIKEPGDRTDEEMWNLEAKPTGYIVK